MDKKTQFNVWFLIAAFFGVLAFQHVWHTARTVAMIPYSQFQQLARDDKVAEVVVTENHIQGQLKEPLPDGQTRFVTRKVDPALARELGAEGVTVAGATEETFIGQVLSWVLPVLVFFGLWSLLMRRFGPGMGGGFMQIGKSKAKIYMETDTKVTFGDVAGVDEAKEELREIVSFLKDPVTYGRLGARTPNGRAADWAARHRQDVAGPCGGR